jgi:maltooligosyltrehalose trehalohydrolase
MPDPQSDTTFHAAKLDWTERELPAHATVLALYRACLHLRARHAVFQSAPRSQWSVEKHGGAVALNWSDPEGDWLLIVSIADGCPLHPAEARAWELTLASNEERFGGTEMKRLVAPGAALWRRNRTDKA